MRLAAAALAAALAGCASVSPSSHVEDGVGTRRIEKAGHESVVSGGTVRIEGEGVFPLLEETPDAFVVAVGLDSEMSAAHIEVEVAPSLFSAPREEALGFDELASGPPTSGQWRDAFVLADFDRDGAVDLVASPPRKHLTTPRVFGLALVDARVVFSERDVAWPSRHYDYGATAVGDFDGDGRTDLAIGMHLTGIATLMRGDDGFVEHSVGLPGNANGLRGSAVTLLARPAPAPDARRDRLLALAEPGRVHGDRADARAGFRGLVEFAFDGARWSISDTLDAQVLGRGLVHSAAGTCREKLAAVGAQADGTLVWERHAKHWKRRALPAPASRRQHATAVALGDFDGDGCADVAAAGAHYIAGGWHATLTVYLDRGEHWEPLPLEAAPRRDGPTALTFARSTCCGPVLATLDENGALRAYALSDRSELYVGEAPAPARERHALRVGEAPAPAELAGCAGTLIAAHDFDADGSDELIASFAGEPTLGRATCLAGGGLAAWRMR